MRIYCTSGDQTGFEFTCLSDGTWEDDNEKPVAGTPSAPATPSGYYCL